MGENSFLGKPIQMWKPWFAHALVWLLITGMGAGCHRSRDSSVSETSDGDFAVLRLRNGSFETWNGGVPDDWRVLSGDSDLVTAEDGTVREGNFSLAAWGSARTIQVSQTVIFAKPVRDGIFVASVFAKSSRAGNVRLVVQLDDGKLYVSEPNVEMGSWERIEVVATPDSSGLTTGLRVILSVDDGDYSVLFDDAGLVASRNRLMETSADGYERWVNGLPLGWALTYGIPGAIERDARDFVEGRYAASIVPWPGTMRLSREWRADGEMAGKFLTVSARVKCGEAKNTYLVLHEEELGDVYSPSHHGGGNWERLYVSVRIPAFSVADRVQISIVSKASRRDRVLVDDWRIDLK